MLTASQSGAPGATGTATRIRRTSSASATRPDVSPPQSTIRRTPDSPMTCLANAPSCSPIPTASASFGPGVRRSGWLPGEVQQTSFGAYLVGVGVMQGIEDPQGVSPGITGLAHISGGEMDVAEVGENLGFEERIADECAGQAQGVLVAEGCRATQGCGCWIRCSAPPTCRFGPCRSWVTH
jgi:hypothetical protein